MVPNFEAANNLAIAPGLNAAVRLNIELNLRKRRRDWSSACFITFSCLLVLDLHFRDPLPDVCGTIPELDAISFAVLFDVRQLSRHPSSPVRYSASSFPELGLRGVSVRLTTTPLTSV